jgi:hypothetical protein
MIIFFPSLTKAGPDIESRTGEQGNSTYEESTVWDIYGKDRLGPEPVSLV